MRTPETEARVFTAGQRVETPFGPGAVTAGNPTVPRDPKRGDLKPVSLGYILVSVDNNPLTITNPLVFWKDELTAL